MTTPQKPNRSTYLAALRSKVQEMSSPKFTNKNDEKFWKPELDKAGTGSAVIRFLPTVIGEEFPFVQLYTHGFKGPGGKWFIDNCPTSIKEDCPACKANSELWNAGGEGSPQRKMASDRKRKLSYISNVLIVNDPKHPENNGKVFLYRYGKKIFDKIKDMIDPPAEFADMEPIDPFCPETGANFKLRVVKVENFPNYDKSAFDTTSTAIGNEDRIAEVLNSMHALNSILDPKEFKTYADLKKRFEQVSGGTAPASDVDPADQEPVVEEVAEAPVSRTAAPAAAPKVRAPRPARSAAPVDESGDDDYFANLAKADAA